MSTSPINGKGSELKKFSNPEDKEVSRLLKSASTSSLFIVTNRPVLTATSELFLEDPVANALGCIESKMPNSGTFILAF